MAGNEYKFEDLLHLTITSLQDFLSLRGLSKPGKKDELVARAFDAYELKGQMNQNFDNWSLVSLKQLNTKTDHYKVYSPNNFAS